MDWILNIYDDDELCRIFDKYHSTEFYPCTAGCINLFGSTLQGRPASDHPVPPGSISAQKLEQALEDLGITKPNFVDFSQSRRTTWRQLPSVATWCGSPIKFDFDDFKLIARQPNEAEQWIQMIPLAGLLARCLRKEDMEGLEMLNDEEIDYGMGLFYRCATKLVKERLHLMKSVREKMTSLTTSNSKFGTAGFKLQGGSVDDFHKGLAERMGVPLIFLLSVLWNRSHVPPPAQDIHTLTLRRV